MPDDTRTADGRWAASSETRRRRSSRIWWLWYSTVCLLTLAVAGLMLALPPSPATIGWLLFVGGVAAIAYEPRYGVYLSLFFVLLSDQILLPWYPFAKNFSSAESLFYLNNQALIFSPLEVYLVLTLLAWLLRGGLRRRLEIRGGILLWPALAFIAFIAVGLIYGLVKNGDANTALWEVRPMFYLPLMLFLVSNLIQTRAHANTMIWLGMISLFVLGTVGLWDFIFVKEGQISRLQTGIEHGQAIRLNTLYVLAAAVWVYRASMAKRLLLPLFIVPCLVTYVAAQRRAAFIALGLGLILLAVALFKSNRLAFWLTVLPAMVVLLIYLGAFWNNQGALGLPARAVRAVVLSNAGNAEENSSDAYRVAENLDISFTIHNANPLTGIGFGHKFYTPVPLPDISSFVWYQYVTHNSVLYIWMKAGLLAFFTMLMLLGLTIMTSVRLLSKLPRDDLSAIALTALAYVVMHFTYAYVDISWETPSMVYVGSMLGLLNSMERIASLGSAPPKGELWRARSILPSEPDVDRGRNRGLLWHR